MAQKISVCIIAKNEEKYIETCLQALKTFDVETVVVDTGSEDRTKEIAAKYADSLFDFEWVGDFSAARNFAASKAKHDYILALDCDEFIERIDETEIEKFLKANPFGVGFLKLTNLVASGNSTAKSINNVGRIYDRRFVHFENRIHEQLRAKNGRDIIVKEVGTSALHVGYMQSKEERDRKNLRNIELLLLQVDDNPEDCYTLYQLAQSYAAIGKEDEAYEIRKKAISLKPPKDEEYTAELLIGYAKSALGANDFSDALVLTDYYKSFKNSPDFLFFLGQVYFANGKMEEAIKTFEEATKLPAGHIEGSNSFFPYHALSVLYESLGEHDKANELEEKSQKLLREAYNM